MFNSNDYLIITIDESKEEAQMIDKKIVLVTGAGGGLGRELVKIFCDAGAIVIGFGRDINKLRDLSIEVNNNRFSYFSVDVGDFHQVLEACDCVVSEYGRIDILFNNAAVYPKVNFIEETAEEWNRTIDTNLNGVANCIKATLPTMIHNKFGRIYNVGSWADLGAIPHSAGYSCTKGAIHSLTRAIYADIKHLNLDIEIHEWIPGHLRTQMSDYTGIEPSIAAKWALDIVINKNISSKNCLFVNDKEWHPPKSIKQRLMSLLLFWKANQH